MVATVSRIQTGIPGLDEILSGGLIAHRLYLVTGVPGSGKTTMALQYLLHGRKAGEKGLYITLSETKEELEAGAKSHGWDLAGIEVMELSTPESSLSSDGQVTMYPTSEVELNETSRAVLDAVGKFAPDRVVFDSLSELRLLAQNSLRYRRQILALKQYFVGRHCTVLLLDDGTSEDSDLQLQSIVHGVISLEQLAPLYGVERRRLRLPKFRGSRFRGGYHDFTIIEGGLNVFPRLVSADYEQQADLAPVPSGLPALDALLGGGPDRGTSTLLVGPAGSGKSTVSIQYAVASAQRGEKAVVFTFDESVATLEKRTRGLGMAVDDVLGSGMLEVRQIDPAELSPGEFTSLVQHAVEDRDARIVVIDSLNGYLNAMPEERFLTIQLHELLSYLGRKRVTTLLVSAQHGLLGTDMRSPVDASYLADSVVLFRYFEHGGKVRKAISVVKKRSGAHEESIRELRLTAKGLSLSEPLAEFHGVMTGLPVDETKQKGPEET
jgi:circadian clock protein KaiC